MDASKQKPGELVRLATHMAQVVFCRPAMVVAIEEKDYSNATVTEAVLVDDTFLIERCEVEKDIIDRPLGEWEKSMKKRRHGRMPPRTLGYYITKIEAIASTRESSPDADYDDFGAFTELTAALGAVAHALFDNYLDLFHTGQVEAEYLEAQKEIEKALAELCATGCGKPHAPNDSLCIAHRKEFDEDEASADSFSQETIDAEQKSCREGGLRHLYRSVCDGGCGNFCKCDMNVCLDCGHNREEGEQD